VSDAHGAGCYNRRQVFLRGGIFSLAFRSATL